MKLENVKSLLDVCFKAKRITEIMPALPKGIKPRHIHVLECIKALGIEQKEVRVSDISRKLNITTPSVTKLINELEHLELISKSSLMDN